MAYAKKTTVTVDRSQSQIKTVLMKNGCEGVAIVEMMNCAVLKFVFEGKVYQFKINYPSSLDHEITHTQKGQKRTAAQVQVEIESEKKRLWRCMLLYTNAAIEAHINGLVKISSSLLANLTLPSGKILLEEMKDNLDKFEVNPNYLLE